MVQEKLNLLRSKLREIGDIYSSNLISIALSDEKLLASFLISNELWGGSGSIADQAGIGDGVRTDQTREIESILINLGEEQICLDKINVRTKNWVNTFRTWKENGI